MQRTSEANGGSLYAQPPTALCESSSGEKRRFEVTIAQGNI